MTVDEDCCQETESLILPTAPVFYPVKIPVGHPQLRCLIASPRTNIIYYASGDSVFRLDTQSRKQEEVACVPFNIRCLAASKEWIVVGGPDNGSMAIIGAEAGEQFHFDGAPIRTITELEAVLPVNLDPLLRRQFHIMFNNGNNTTRRPQQMQTLELGDLIVNSVTLFQSAHDDLGDTEGPVAVLTNNDKNVRIYSLRHGRLLATLEFPYATNHASLSPDGNLLVVVGDDPVVSFCRRDSSGGSRSSWKICAQALLSDSPSRLFAKDGCFATAFSPSGHLCAVASQDGIITIFGTQYIGDPETGSDEEAIVKVMPSSRPRSEAGAIRSMCFAPEPYDLLVCVEHSGRVCIMDVRDQFRSRQIVKLSTDPDIVTVITPSFPRHSNELVDPRLRGFSDGAGQVRPVRATDTTSDESSSTVMRTPDAIEVTSQRRRTSRLMRDESPRPFTTRERQVLDALRTSRERVEAREQYGQAYRQRLPLSLGPHSISYAHHDAALPFVFDSSVSTSPGNAINPIRPTTVTERRSAPLPWTDYATSVISSQSSVPTIREYIRDRNTDRDRTRARYYEPRRQDSIAVSAEGFETDPASGSGSGAIRDAPEVRMPSSSLLGSRLAHEENIDPWHTIEAAMAAGPLPDAASSVRREREAGLEPTYSSRQEIYLRLEQRRRERLRNLYTEVEGISRYTEGMASESGRDAEPGTSGVAISEDGRKLYVGVTSGILEYQINLHGRRCFPEIVPM